MDRISNGEKGYSKDRIIMEEKGKLLFSNYMEPKFDKSRKAMDVFTIVLFVLFLTMIVIFRYYPNDEVGGFGLVFFTGSIAMVIYRYRFNSEDFRIHEYGIEARFLRKPKSKKAAHLGTPVGVRFFTFDKIEKIYHRTDIGKPIKNEPDQASIGWLIICIDISDSDLCCILPLSAISDVLFRLESLLGDEYYSVYQAPEDT